MMSPNSKFAVIVDTQTNRRGIKSYEVFKKRGRVQILEKLHRLNTQQATFESEL